MVSSTMGSNTLSSVRDDVACHLSLPAYTFIRFSLFNGHFLSPCGRGRDHAAEIGHAYRKDSRYINGGLCVRVRSLHS